MREGDNSGRFVNGLDQPIGWQYLYMLGNVTCRTKSADEKTTNGLQFSVGAYEFKCLDFGDSRLTASIENRFALAEKIRAARPKTVPWLPIR